MSTDPTSTICLHDAANIVAILESRAEKANVEGLAERGLWWSQLRELADSGDLPAVEDLDADVYLATCTSCDSAVVSVRTWDRHRWTAGHGRGFSTPWTPLFKNGQGRPVTGPESSGFGVTAPDGGGPRRP